jgi:D-inositol-3-phosphate glycosyltransferase
VLRLADRIVAATPAELAQLQWLYNADTRKIAVIPPGVDISRFYPIPQDEAKEVIGVPPCEDMLLFVGRIEPLKGLDTLIQAIAQMHAQGVYVCLTVIGGDPDTSPEAQSAEMARVQSLRQQAGLADLITFLGKRGQDTLPYYYSAADVVVVPSYYESFGMVALEAMACGTPVVASQVGGLAFLVQDGVTGFTVPVDEPQALAEKLMMLVRDGDLRQNLGQQALSVAQQYAWEHIAARILALYGQALTSS